MQFEYGFIYNDVKYGWYKKELYRLPFTRLKRSHGILKIEQRIMNVTPYYIVQRNKLTLKRVEGLTTKVDWKVDVIKSKDCPF